jgi:hypothetical protein
MTAITAKLLCFLFCNGIFLQTIYFYFAEFPVFRGTPFARHCSKNLMISFQFPSNGQNSVDKYKYKVVQT